MPDKGQILLNTKPGCYIGIRTPVDNRVIVGQLDTTCTDPSIVRLRRSLEYDKWSYKILGSVSDEPRELKDVDPDNMLLGKELMRNLGGDEEANKILDAFGFQYNPQAHKEYVHARKQAVKDKKRADKLAAKEEMRSIENYQNPFVKFVKAVPGGLKSFGQFYAHGYVAPLTYKKTDQLLPYSLRCEDVEGAAANGGVTTGINAITAAAVGLPIALDAVSGGPGKGYDLNIDDPVILAASAVFVALPLIPLAAKGVIEGTKAIGRANERRRKEKAKIQRLERFRQAVCPADSETYYEI